MALPTTILTDARVKSFKGNGKQQEIRDGQFPLRLIVQPSGAKSWQYRWKADGKGHRHTYGHYPEMSLADARDASLRFRCDLKSKGIAPVAAPVIVAPVVDVRMTVSEAYALYMASDKVTKLAGETIKEKERAFEKDVEPAVGTMALLDLSYEDIEEIIENKYEATIARGLRGITANRLHSNISGFLKWCRSSGRKKTGLKENPMADMPKPAEERALNRFFSEKELDWFFRALPVVGGHAKSYELLLRTVSRRSEILDLRWGMVEGDKIVLPNTKNGCSHIISLTPSALALVGTRPDGMADDARVFNNCPTANSKAMDRLRARMSELAMEDGSNAEIERWSLHTFRRTGTTIMASFHDADERQLISPHIRSRLLNHIDSSVRGQVYDRYDNFSEKKSALMLWGDYLDRAKNCGSRSDSSQSAQFAANSNDTISTSQLVCLP